MGDVIHIGDRRKDGPKLAFSLSEDVRAARTHGRLDEIVSIVTLNRWLMDEAWLDVIETKVARRRRELGSGEYPGGSAA